jgi:hypothetical protein
MRGFLVALGVCAVPMACVGEGVELTPSVDEPGRAGRVSTLDSDPGRGGSGSSATVGSGSAHAGTSAGGAGAAIGIGSASGRGGSAPDDVVGQGGDGDPANGGNPTTGGEAGSTWSGACDRGSVNGDVVLADDDDVHLLSGVVEISGSLSIGPNVSELSLLTCLERVGGRLSLVENDHLRTLGGLSSLRRVGRLHVIGCGELESLAGLERLVRADSVDLLYLPKLATLESLRALTRVGELDVRETAIRNLHGLEGVATLSRIYLLENSALVSVDGLEGLSAVGQILIRNSPSFESLSGFRNVTVVGDGNTGGNIGLHGLGALVDLAGLGSVTSAAELWLSDNAVLSSMRGLDALTSLTRLQVEVCPRLESVALPPLTSLDWVDLIDCPLLESLDVIGAPRFRRVALIETGLTNLDALQPLAEVDYLFVVKNPNLGSLRSLGGLERVEGLTVVDNMALPTCEAEWLLANTAVTTATIERNDDAGICPP